VTDFDPSEWLVEIEQMTAVMRVADAFPFWVELRGQLSGMGIDPQQALLVEAYEEGGDEVGVVVAPEASVLAYRRSRLGWAWNDLSGTWALSEYADQVRVGLSVLQEPRRDTQERA
jgi:hypothetical protein